MNLSYVRKVYYSYLRQTLTLKILKWNPGSYSRYNIHTTELAVNEISYVIINSIWHVTSRYVCQLDNIIGVRNVFIHVVCLNSIEKNTTHHVN